MKQLAVSLLLIVSFAMAGCGSSNSSANNSANVNGNWTAALTDTNGNQVFNFGTSLVVNSDGSLAVSNLKFTTNSSCFESGETASGSFGLSGTFSGNVTGTFQMTIASQTPAGNTLTLVGAVNGKTITGTWTLTGSGGCTGAGKFTMTKP